MKFMRLCSLLSKMPSKLSKEELTKEEAHLMWSFLDSSKRITMSTRMVKVQLAKECGCFVEHLDDVTNGKPLAEVLTWESGGQSKGYTVKELMTLAHNASESQEDWVLKLCNAMTVIEGQVFWSWALNYKWSPYRYRMVKWLKQQFNHESKSMEFYINSIYSGISDSILEDAAYTPLQIWTDESCDTFWFVQDCTTLVQLKQGIAKRRTGILDFDLTPQVPDDTPLMWCWSNPLGTHRLHNVKHDIPFSSYKEPMPTSWEESQQLLHHYPKGGFIIFHEGEYYLKTSGTISLQAQVTHYRNVNGTWEFNIGFRDGIDVVDMNVFTVEENVFELDYALRRIGITPTVKNTSEPISDTFVVKVEYTWSPSKEWHFRFNTVVLDAGLSDVDELVDYLVVVNND